MWLSRLSQARLRQNAVIEDADLRTPRGLDRGLLGYFNPFPADRASPAAPIFDMYGAQLNAIIQSLAIPGSVR